MASLALKCPYCGGAIQVSDEVGAVSGAQVTCPKCSRVATVLHNGEHLQLVAAAAATPPVPPPIPAPASAPTATPPGIPATVLRPGNPGLAIVGLILGISGLVTCGLGAIAGLICSIIAVRQARQNNGRVQLAIVGIVVSALVLALVPIGALVAILLPSLTRAREKANEIQCAANLRQIGQALNLYASENRGLYPRTFYRQNETLILGNDGADLRQAAGDPFRDAPNNPVGINNIPASLFLLMRTQSISANVFICPSSQQTQDTLTRGTSTKLNVSDCGNFGDVGKNLSYAYVNPYAGTQALVRGYRLSMSMSPELPLMADKGPGVQGAGENVYATHLVDAPRNDIRKMNSSNHGYSGQNVLFADGHVEFVNTPFSGVHHNHIYVPDTQLGETDTQRSWDGAGSPGVPQNDPTRCLPLDGADTVLLPWDD